MSWTDYFSKTLSAHLMSWLRFVLCVKRIDGDDDDVINSPHHAWYFRMNRRHLFALLLCPLNKRNIAVPNKQTTAPVIRRIDWHSCRPRDVKASRPKFWCRPPSWPHDFLTSLPSLCVYRPSFGSILFLSKRAANNAAQANRSQWLIKIHETVIDSGVDCVVGWRQQWHPSSLVRTTENRYTDDYRQSQNVRSLGLLFVAVWTVLYLLLIILTAAVGLPSN